ncbi:MAG: PQQ-binding-like beta-propeller repeat protein, partial [Planctomycetota bacterium]
GGDIGPRIERLETRAGAARGGDAESRRELARLAEELLDMARAELLMLEPGMRARLTAAALRLLPDGDRLAGAAFRAAVAAARRGERGTAAGFGYLALESQRGSTVTLDGILRVPVELAVRRLLEELRDEDGVLSGSEEAEQLAHRRLEELRVGDLLGPLLETARRFPCTPSGRRAMLQAARDYYQRGSLDQGILTLRRLILLEPETPEAVEARFRLASLARESRRPEGAREILEELRDRYGGLTVTASRDGESHDETVAVRAERILGELPEDGMGPGETPASAGHHLAPVWRMRSELHFRGSAHVEPLERHPGHEGDTRLLLIAHRTVQLREASTGDLLWSTTIPPPPSVGEEPSWSRLLAFEPPLSITDGTAIIRDREELLAVDLEQGHVRWRLRLPPLSTVEGGEEEDDAAAGAPPNLIGEAVVAGDTLFVSGADQRLHAHDVRDGAHLWSRKIALTLAGPPHVAGRLVLLGSGSGRRVEVRNIDDGALDVVIPLEEGETLAQEPWFLDDTTIAIPLREGRLLAVNAKDGEEIWSRQLPGPLKRVLLLAGVPFLVAELHWHRDRPTLLGIHGPSGRILWEKRFRGHRPSIYEIRCFGGDLFLTEGENDQRKVIRLEVPRAFLEEEVPEGLPAGELRRRWTAPLKQGWDVVHLHLDQEWILAEDGLRCEVTPFSRETGAPLYRSLRYRAMEEFLKGRRRLFFADFVGDTLVLMTSRGSMGLRAFRPLEEEERLWEQLLALSPLADPAPGGQPLDASETAYR